MTQNIKHLAQSVYLRVFFLSNFIILIEIEGLNVKYLSSRWNYCITILAHYNKETYQIHKVNGDKAQTQFTAHRHSSKLWELNQSVVPRCYKTERVHPHGANRAKHYTLRTAVEVPAGVWEADALKPKLLDGVQLTEYIGQNHETLWVRGFGIIQATDWLEVRKSNKSFISVLSTVLSSVPVSLYHVSWENSQGVVPPQDSGTET